MRALNRLEEETVGGGVVWVEYCGCGGSLLKVEHTLKLKGFGMFIRVSLFVGLLLNSTTCNTIRASSSRVTFVMPHLQASDTSHTKYDSEKSSERERDMGAEIPRSPVL